MIDGEQIDLMGEPECERCVNPIPGMPAHEPSRRCHYRLRGYYVAHCSCAACF